MKDPSRYEELLGLLTQNKPVKESVKDQIKKAVMEVLQEKKLSKTKKLVPNGNKISSSFR
jgi:hypothetical protein